MSQQEEEVHVHEYQGPDRRQGVPKAALTVSSIITILTVVFTIVVQTTILVNWASTFRADFIAEKELTSRRFGVIERTIKGAYSESDAAKDLALRDERISTLLSTVSVLQNSIANTMEKLETRLRECERATRQ